MSPDCSTRARRLRFRLQQRYRLTDEALRVGPLTLPFTRIASPDEVLDDVIAVESALSEIGDERALEALMPPYWAELWDSSFGVAELLARRGWALFGGCFAGAAAPRPRVLDLGCGMGLTGLVAATLDARVLLADIEPAALLLARLNTIRFARFVRARRVDWRRDRLRERFDVILGADVLYERSQWDFLEPFFRAHLQPGGAVLLGEPGRPSGDSFASWIAARGWRWRCLEQPVPTHQRPIRLFLVSPER